MFLDLDFFQKKNLIFFEGGRWRWVAVEGGRGRLGGFQGFQRFYSVLILEIFFKNFLAVKKR